MFYSIATRIQIIIILFLFFTNISCHKRGRRVKKIKVVHPYDESATLHPYDESSTLAPYESSIPSPYESSTPSSYESPTPPPYATTPSPYATFSTLFTTTTNYLTPNTNQHCSSPWDVKCSKPPAQVPGACSVQECDPDTNEISEASIPCGCHSGQKPVYVRPSQSPLPGCYTNNDGYTCCNQEVEQVLISTYEEFKSQRCGHQNIDNVQHLANMVQKNLENHFPNVTYESLVGNSDFASKTQFSGNHMCKIRRECKVIMVYASPNQEGVGCGNETDQGYIVPPVTDSYYVPVSQIDPSYNIPPTPPTPPPYGRLPNADNQYNPVAENQYYPVNEKMASFIEQQHPNYVGPYKYPPAATDFLCFSGDTKVWTDQGVYKRMSDLNVGDYVLSSNLNFTKVLRWLHKIPRMQSTYLKIYLGGEHTLEISSKHLIYKADCSVSADNYDVHNTIIFSEELKIGDCLFVVDDTKTMVMIKQIQKIDMVISTGVYSPETEFGDIVVNDVIASCYTNIKTHMIVKMFKKVNSYFNQAISWFYGEERSHEDLIDLPITFKLIITMIEELLPVKIL